MIQNRQLLPPGQILDSVPKRDQKREGSQGALLDCPVLRIHHSIPPDETREVSIDTSLACPFSFNNKCAW